MDMAQAGGGSGPRPLRLWPGVAAVVLQWLLWFVLPLVNPDYIIYGLLGGLACAVLVLVWWLFFSRAARLERFGAIPFMVLAVVITMPILDKSIATGMMSMMFPMYVIPVLCLALVAGAAAGRRMADGPRRITLAAAILAACGVFALLRTNGITGSGQSQLAWRWSKDSEQQLLAQKAKILPVVAAAPAAVPVAAKESASVEIPKSEAPRASVSEPRPPKAATAPARPVAPAAEWAGFRGPHRDSVVHGVRIKTDWTASPPVRLWRQPVGPGWSSFAVSSGRLYTQEQRGDSEVVACYKVSTGEPVWAHQDAARFWESNGGAGPRGTPTLSDGYVYTLGATGILNALHAGNGSVVWTRNAAADTGEKLPGWGFTSSPLVVGDELIVATSGRMAAYDRATGAPRWQGPDAGDSYGSPQLLTLDGVAQVVMVGHGTYSVAASDGKVLWKHPWPGFTILQPTWVADNSILVTGGSGGGGEGTRRLAIEQGTGGFSAKEVWTSRGLKPYFNDLVVHKGHAYGFDGSILACIDLKDGQRKWKGGRYGNGQLLLLADQDLLLVLSEEGELALVSAVPEQFTELAHLTAIEGKTWNHPVLAHDILLVRNGQEMTAFRVALEQN